MTEIRPIRNDADHAKALKEIERLWNAKKGSADADRLEALAILVEAYEKKRYPIAKPDPISAIEFRLEQMGLTRKAPEGVIGSRGRVSDIMNRRRSLTLNMIRRLNDKFAIPAEVLIQPVKILTSPTKKHRKPARQKAA